MKIFICLILSMCTESIFASPVDGLNCDDQILGDGRTVGASFMGLVRLGQSQGDIEMKDLEWLKDQHEPANPVRQGRSERNVFLKRGFERLKPLLSLEEWAAVKAGLREYSAALSARSARVDVAKVDTAPIYFLKPLNLNLHKPTGTTIRTFTSREGEFFYQSLNSGSFVAELKSGRKYPIDDVLDNTYTTDFFQAKDGEVYYAWVDHDTVQILNLRTGAKVFKKSFLGSLLLADYKRRLGTVIAPTLFETPMGLGVALLAPPGNGGDTNREKPLVVYDMQGNEMRSELLPLGKSSVARLEDGNIYAFGIGEVKKTSDRTRVFISEIGQGLSGIEAVVPKERVDFFEGVVPQLYLKDGKPEMIFLPRKLSAPVMYNQMTSTLRNMPGVKSAFVTMFNIFKSDQGKPSFVVFEMTEDGSRLPVLKVGEIGNLQSVKEYQFRQAVPGSHWPHMQIVEGPTGPTFIFWEALLGSLKAVNFLDLRTGHLIHVPVPQNWSVGEASDAFYDPSAKRMMVFLRNLSTGEWDLFQLYGERQ